MATFYSISLLFLVFSFFRFNIPLCLRCLFQLNSEFHSIFNPLVTRYQDYLSFHYIPIFRTAFSHISVKYFNSVPVSIKTSSFLSSCFRSASCFIASLTVFKRNCNWYVCRCLHLWVYARMCIILIIAYCIIVLLLVLIFCCCFLGYM